MDKIRYVINGKEYNSLDEVPSEFRSLLEDKNRDGLPDIINKDMLKSGEGGVTTYTHNGVKYNSLEEMPPEIRAIIEKMQNEGKLNISGKSHVNFSVKVNRVVTTSKSSDIGLKLSRSHNAGDVRNWESPEKYIEELKRGQSPDEISPSRGGFWSRLFGKKR